MSSPLFKILLIAIICAMGSSQFLNPGCANFDSAGNCISCLTRNYMFYGICLPVSPLCLTYDSTNGNCLTCYSGFMISGKDCVPIPKIANCNTYSSTGACTSCVTGFYLSNNTCNLVSPLCKTYDTTNGNCLSCWDGFNLINTTCTPTPISNCKNQSSIICNTCNTGYYLLNNTCKIGDTRCTSYNQSICIACSAGFAPAESICVTAIENCVSYFPDGSCLNCTSGYEYTGLICEKILIPDPNCHIYDNNTNCLECSKGYYFDANSTCIQANTNCKTFDNKNGDCTSCYTGFSLNQTTCIQNPQTLDPFCSKFNGSVCLACSKGYRFNVNQTCMELDSSCQSFDNTTFACVECYKGYTISINGTCILNPDINCNIWKIGGCVKCYHGFYPLNGTCQQLDPLCSSFDPTTNNCLKCYIGYSISSTGVCQENRIFNVNNNFCSKFDSNDKCTSCFNGYYLSNGVCVLLTFPCKTYIMTTGSCTSCYKGYKIEFKTRNCIPFL